MLFRKSLQIYRVIFFDMQSNTGCCYDTLAVLCAVYFDSFDCNQEALFAIKSVTIIDNLAVVVFVMGPSRY